MRSSPHAHPLAEHSAGRIADGDVNARDAGTRRPEQPDDEAVTTRRLEAITAYERAWSLVDEEAIRADLERCWTASSMHVNPFTDTVRGIDGLTQLILDFPAMFPGATFRLSSLPDIHHDVARFSWRLSSTERIRILGRDFGCSVEGVDYVQFDPDHRIRQVIAFYGPLTPKLTAPPS
ncbi:MAG: hypothetical protein WAL50_22455 [Kineosporiaceae bacterium]|jgi:hypothetical protein